MFEALKKLVGIEPKEVKTAFSDEVFINYTKSAYLRKMSSYHSKNDLDVIHNAYWKRFPNGSYGDLIWALYNQTAIDTVRDKDYQTLGQIYYDMAVFKNENGKNSYIMNQLSKKYELMGYKESGVVVGVQISACDNACNICKGFNNNKYILNRAIKEQPLPHKECTGMNGLCRCGYIALTEDNW